MRRLGGSPFEIYTWVTRLAARQALLKGPIDMIGRGVNNVTEDYSRGAAGQWVENGEIQYPVHEITIAGNLKELYPRISAIGND